MLNTVAAQAVVFAHIVKAGVPLKGTLIFCAVPDEEAGGQDGVGCVRHEGKGRRSRACDPCAHVCLVHHHRYLLSDPELREVFRTDFLMTELGGPWLLGKNQQPTKTVIQVNTVGGGPVVASSVHRGADCLVCVHDSLSRCRRTARRARRRW
jgi:hypothetical protein